MIREYGDEPCGLMAISPELFAELNDLIISYMWCPLPNPYSDIAHWTQCNYSDVWVLINGLGDDPEIYFGAEIEKGFWDGSED